jgi:hypothetical protein
MTDIRALIRDGGWAFLAAVALACGGRGGRATPDTSSRDTTQATVPAQRAAPRNDTANTVQSSGARDSAQASAAQGDSVTALLATGCGGGFTGGGGGTFVTADGRFYRYQRGGASPNAKRELTFVRRDSAQAAALVQAAERAGITRINYSEPANMTCSLTLTRGGTSHEVAWAMGTTPKQIEQLVAVAKRLEQFAR